MAKSFRTAALRLVPEQVQDAIIGGTFSTNQELTAVWPQSPLTLQQVTTRSRRGQHFEADSYWYSFGYNARSGTYSWRRNYQGASASAGGGAAPVDLSNYYQKGEVDAIVKPLAPSDSPVFTGVPRVPTIANITKTTILDQALNVQSLIAYLSSTFGFSGAILLMNGAKPQAFSTLSDALQAIPGTTTGYLWTNVTNTDAVDIRKNCVIQAIAPLGPVSVNTAVSCTINGNISCIGTRDAIFVNTGTLHINGDVFIKDTTTNVGITIFPYGNVIMRGNLTLDDTREIAFCFASSENIAANGQVPFFDFDGTMRVLNKGSLLRMRADVVLRGLLKSKDGGLISQSGYTHDIMAIVDLRESTSTTLVPLRLLYGSFNQPKTTFHAGSALLAPASVVSMLSNDNADVAQKVYFSKAATVSKPLVAPPNTTITYIDELANVYTDSATGTNYRVSITNGNVAYIPV